MDDTHAREPDGHEYCPACRAAGTGPGRSPISRRAALGLAARAGVAAVAGTHLLRAGGRGGAADLRAARALAAPRPDWPVPPIVTRAQWGADESLRGRDQVYDGVVEKIVVHHTGAPVGDPAAHARGVYAHALSTGYSDVPYHWLISPDGRIFEGRWAADYPAGQPHTGERNGANVRGAHASAHNSRTIGVALMGNYEGGAPPAVAVEALVTVLAWKCARWGIDPLGAGTYTNSYGASYPLPNICTHQETKQRIGDGTLCPGTGVIGGLAGVRDRVAARLRDGSTGYWIATANGMVFSKGQMPDAGDTNRLGLPASVVGITAHPSGLGYWLLGRDGGVFTFGAARFFGSMGGVRLNQPMINIASTRTGNGYWMVARDGGVFSFGDARFFGSTGGMRLAAPVLGLCPTPSGNGYWLYARDGGIFSFGDARFFGSTGGLPLVRPVVAMAARPQGDGYWLAAEDGGVFAFGNAPFRGSAVGRTRSPFVSILPTTTGNGYALLDRDGGVHTFGDAPNHGGVSGWGLTAVGLAGKLKP
ncbi:MAG: hypothetical protein KatS3mg009_3326 [Acidimicrobiia bacterium]|nr:MAG: hypothetical protein KatS3mg009_3326 [Acidimicrobiia bacterium]